MNIQNVISDLRSTGLTQQALADLVPCSQSTINAYERGNRSTRPAFNIVSRLIELHKEICLSGDKPSRVTSETTPGKATESQPSG